MLRLSELLEQICPAGTPGAPTEGAQQHLRDLQDREIADIDVFLRGFEAEADQVLAASTDVTATAVFCDGHRPFDALLTIARKWDADLIVMGRSDMRRPGQCYVGSQTEHLLEFTEIPVLVVPAAERSAS